MSETDYETKGLNEAATIAREACGGGQPMLLKGMDAELVADACEVIGDEHATKRNWKAAATAFKMALWYNKAKI